MEIQKDARDVHEQRQHEKAARGWPSPSLGVGGLREPTLFLHLDLDFPPPELCKINLCCLVTHLWYFITAALANEYSP